MPLLLGLETSCDETSASLVEEGRVVLSTVTQTSVADFTDLGGIIPEQAARRQLECILPVVDAALKKAQKSWDDIHAIAVTRGPGLIGSLIVGVATARVLASVLKKPLIGVHHTLGHLTSTWLVEKETNETKETKEAKECSSDSSESSDSSPTFPVLTLSVSGGHTELWFRTNHLEGDLLGQTLDDAAGEAFDKGAVLLGLPFPGGPALAKLAEGGNPKAFDFPLPLKKEPGMDFSFSGLKTALKYLLRDLKGKPTNPKKPRKPKSEHSLDSLDSLESLDSSTRADIAASYQEIICLHLLDRVKKALQQYPQTREFHLVGGVAANKRLRTVLQEFLQSKYPRTRFRTPTCIEYCTDNAAMIAAAGYVLLKHNPERARMPFETSASVELSEITGTLQATSYKLQARD